MSSEKTPDDLEAVRAVVAAIEPFGEDADRKRILRWAAEKLSLPEPFGPRIHEGLKSAHLPTHVTAEAPPTRTTTSTQETATDIRSFVESKQPKTDIQFAAVVAYFYEFVASENERKDAIDKEMLKDAFRKSKRKIPKDCGFTLVNALNAGLLDRKDGMFSVNSVGENLVAMTLPGDAKVAGTVRKPKKKTATPSKKSKSPARSK